MKLQYVIILQRIQLVLIFDAKTNWTFAAPFGTNMEDRVVVAE